MRFEVLKVSAMKMTVFWDVMPFGWVGRCFCLHLQSTKAGRRQMMAVGSPKTLVFMKLHSSASKKAIIFTVFCPCGSSP
jgi:hypothetical protein